MLWSIIRGPFKHRSLSLIQPPCQILGILDSTSICIQYFENSNLFSSDKTAPTFMNCFTQGFTVELYKAPNHVIPTATDQSGFVRSIVTTPANYRPTHVVPSTMTVTYTAIDDNGNSGTCSFKVNVKGKSLVTMTTYYIELYMWLAPSRMTCMHSNRWQQLCLDLFLLGHHKGWVSGNHDKPCYMFYLQWLLHAQQWMATPTLRLMFIFGQY